MANNNTEITCSPVTLRRLRIKACLSQTELALLAGKTAVTVSRVESGERIAQPRTTRALAAALGVEAWELHPRHEAQSAVA